MPKRSNATTRDQAGTATTGLSSLTPTSPTTPTSSTTLTSPSTKTTTPKPSLSSSSGSRPNPQNWDRVLLKLYDHYVEATPQRIKLVDIFMAFLVVLGAVQFAYCVLAGNYPFNAFLSGFAGTIGQFILTASLRAQVSDTKKLDTPTISPERAFTDYIVCSLILHFFCINFIN